MKREKEKMASGELYDANYDPELLAEREACKERLYDYNRLRPADTIERERTIRRLLGHVGEHCIIESPFHCDYGCNIHVGENFYANVGLTVLDGASVTFGDNCFIGPYCGFHTAGHPLEVELRNRGLEYARPIKVGNNVWFGAQCCVLPGVTIGDNTVIGAGSVVTHDIPSGVLAAGNPCCVIRPIEAEPKAK